MRLIFTVAALLLTTFSVCAEEVVADLSSREVAITANFDGSDILIYGAVKREEPEPLDRLHVIVTVEGPSLPIAVRKKDRRFGIWINTASVEVDRAPSFYAISSTGNLSTILHDTEDLRHKISINRAIRSVGAPDGIENSQDFTDALIRIRKNSGLYSRSDNSVELFESTLFSTTIDLPANLVEGPYLTQIYLVRDGSVVDRYATAINVNKVGLERWIYDLAHNQPLAYGLLSIFIAITAGWLASAFFRYLRF
jgi:uncharacterized protein (TIGR02186 family)